LSEKLGLVHQALQEASPGTYFIRLKFGGDEQQVERVVKVE
jgi:hypothetical protein